MAVAAAATVVASGDVGSARRPAPGHCLPQRLTCIEEQVNQVCMNYIMCVCGCNIGQDMAEEQRCVRR